MSNYGPLYGEKSTKFLITTFQVVQRFGKSLAVVLVAEKSNESDTMIRFIVLTSSQLFILNRHASLTSNNLVLLRKTFESRP